jgi:3-hydroxyisobutyrate dehydrogenase-like beta-hydroxyacid dehydrogenase
MKVGFIGLGTMGGSMALNLRKAGYEMTVNDMRRDAGGPHLEAGAKWVETAREVAAASDVVFTSLPGPKEAEAVGNEMLDAMPKGAVWFDLSTNSPTLSPPARPLRRERHLDARRAGERRAAWCEVGQARADDRRRQGRVRET